MKKLKKYRVTPGYEDTYNVICLSCKSEYSCGSHPKQERWKYCPICGIEFLDEFTKRNPRYNRYVQPKDTNKFIIETRYWTKESNIFSKLGLRTTEIKLSSWNQYTQTNIHWHGKSSAVDMFKLYKMLKDTHDSVRLLYKKIDTGDIKVIFEHTKPYNQSKLNNLSVPHMSPSGLQ